MHCSRYSIFLILVGLAMTVFFATQVALAADPTLVVTPQETVLSPALFKQPIQITGSGWKPNEPVVVNMKLPQGVTVKGLNPGEDVGIAGGTADGKGEFKGKVDALTLLMTFFQVEWDNVKMKADFTKAKPLPPGTYPLVAIGFESDTKATATLTLLAPPPKKKK